MKSTFIKKPFAMAAAAFLLSSVAGVALAAPSTSNPLPGSATAHKVMHHGSGGEHHGHRCAFMKELNLSAKQKEQLKAVHQRFRDENKTTFEALRAKHKEIEALGTDPANAEKKQALRKELREEHHALSEKHHQMMDGILTPAQLEQMKSIKTKCRAEHHGPHGAKGGGSHHHHGPDDKPAADMPPKD